MHEHLPLRPGRTARAGRGCSRRVFGAARGVAALAALALAVGSCATSRIGPGDGLEDMTRLSETYILLDLPVGDPAKQIGRMIDLEHLSRGGRVGPHGFLSDSPCSDYVRRDAEHAFEEPQQIRASAFRYSPQSGARRGELEFSAHAVVESNARSELQRFAHCCQEQGCPQFYVSAVYKGDYQFSGAGSARTGARSKWVKGGGYRLLMVQRTPQPPRGAGVHGAPAPSRGAVARSPRGKEAALLYWGCRVSPPAAPVSAGALASSCPSELPTPVVAALGELGYEVVVAGRRTEAPTSAFADQARRDGGRTLGRAVAAVVWVELRVARWSRAGGFQFAFAEADAWLQSSRGRCSSAQVRGERGKEGAALQSWPDVTPQGEAARRALDKAAEGLAADLEILDVSEC